MLSLVLVMIFGIIFSSHNILHTWVTGISVSETKERIEYMNEESKLISEKILGKWTDELWLGIENSNIPLPLARISDHDSIWPPYY